MNRELQDILDRLSDCRVRVVIADGRPLIRPPASGLTPDERQRLDRLLPALAEHRAAILAHLAPAAEPVPEVTDTAVPTPVVPWNCSPCRRSFFAPPAEVMDLIRLSPAWCETPNCPQRS